MPRSHCNPNRMAMIRYVHASVRRVSFLDVSLGFHQVIAVAPASELKSVATILTRSKPQ